MNIIYMLLAISVFVALVFFAAFIYSVKKGQYDDMYTPSVRMLFEDELVDEKKETSKSTNETTPRKKRLTK
ncbi:cbb3-type cytochrome oxidase assembly protein CcoS [Bizionia gelidisalsuginis]|uniref:Cbb3-type cytochrome oxidase assembly protein CcoS n=2 Tax=Bizionia TaxID=283785 RepID=A0A8H2LDE3_9FLAO|nr:MULTISPECIES: cbb3-type cytochrome oxidase assembly protein CcoS [Bizionia]TYB74459.1 cbb3-type cytochrome oxidase assembly protein CcoS [Bizionia saleffrena]TYC16254.1 cbb3-type cytochrome oxidase assembly protein CcoS [Bizionia gelidisalsuginis]